MKITTNLLRSRAGKSHNRKGRNAVKYLNLSRLGIEFVSRLSVCSQLTVVDLQNNSIEHLADLDCCPHLWKINLANNKLRCISGLSRFLALGTLILSNNELSWQSISRLQHMHILHLSLHGNWQMERHPHYRHHVIDCLPLVWMLDGRIVSSSEQHQVRQFFQDSALTKQPERHKLYVGPFTAASLKHLQLNAVFGPRAVHMRMKFPLNDIANRDLDSRRLQYLAYNLQEDLAIETKHVNWVRHILKENGQFLEDLLEIRKLNTRRCSLFVLLLLATMEFAVPTCLLCDTLKLTRMLTIGYIKVMDIFRLPKEIRCMIACLIVNAIKVEKDHGENGGLYDKLYLCMLNTMIRMMRLVEGSSTISMQNVLGKSAAQTQEDSSLIASEMIQVLAMVPSFFTYVTTDVGIQNIVKIACPNIEIEKIVHEINQHTDVNTDVLSLEMRKLVLMAARETALSITNRGTSISREEAHVLSTSKALPMRPLQEPIYSADFLATGKTVPSREPTRVNSTPVCRTDSEQCHVPEVGEEVLLAALTVGHIISLPEPTLLLVQLSAIPVESGGLEASSRYPPDHLVYVDLASLQWDGTYNFWRPKGSTGNRVSMSYGKAVSPLRVRVSRYGPIHTIPQTGMPLQPVSCVTPTADANKCTVQKPKGDTEKDEPKSPKESITSSSESAKEADTITSELSMTHSRSWLIPVPELEILDKLMGERPTSSEQWIQLYTRSLSTYDEGKIKHQPTSPRVVHTVECNRNINMFSPVSAHKMYRPVVAAPPIKVEVPTVNVSRRESLQSTAESELDVVVVTPSSPPAAENKQPSLDVNENANAATSDDDDEDRMSWPYVNHWVVSPTEKTLSPKLNVKRISSSALPTRRAADRGNTSPRRKRCQTSGVNRVKNETSQSQTGTPCTQSRLMSPLTSRSSPLPTWPSSHEQRIVTSPEQPSSGVPSCHGNQEEECTESGDLPPQPPSTPTPMPHMRAVPVRQADSWLAGGRNVHDDMVNKTRPNSSSGLLIPSSRLTARRSATSRIVTPSSILHESIYGSQRLLQQRTPQLADLSSDNLYKRPQSSFECITCIKKRTQDGSSSQLVADDKDKCTALDDFSRPQSSARRHCEHISGLVVNGTVS